MSHDFPKKKNPWAKVVLLCIDIEQGNLNVRHNFISMEEEFKRSSLASQRTDDSGQNLLDDDLQTEIPDNLPNERGRKKSI